MPSATAQTTLSQRDRHLRDILEQGYGAWRRASGYCRRVLVKAHISRIKRVIGDVLRSRADRQRATAVSLVVEALNRMLKLGRSRYVWIVCSTRNVHGIAACAAALHDQ